MYGAGFSVLWAKILLPVMSKKKKTTTKKL